MAWRLAYEKLPFSLFLALKYLRPKRAFISVVTIISILGVLLGVAILVIVLSVMTGFDNTWRDNILSFKPHLTITSPLGVIENEAWVCDKVAAIDGIKGAAASVETRVLLQYKGRMLAPIVLGVDPQRAASVSKVPENITWGKFDLEGERAVVGIDLAGSLGLELGSKILIYSPLNVVHRDELYLPVELEIAGIFDLGMRDFDSGFVFTSIDVARELMGMEEGARSIYVMTDDAFRFEFYAEQVRKLLGPAYSVRTWKEVDSLLFDALSHEKTMMFVLLVFITIVAIFCVTNTLIVITVHKTNEIGLLKALGFPASRIMAAFVWHGWIQCLVGTAAGIGTGLLILNNLTRIVGWLRDANVSVFPKEIYGLSEIPWEASATEIGRISLVVIVFCTLASILPAWRAARLDPVEALRHE